jgi:hypothetical protein
MAYKNKEVWEIDLRAGAVMACLLALLSIIAIACASISTITDF